MNKDTHVLVDELGVAVLSGTKEEMLEALEELKLLGYENIKLKAIDN